jgi:hypothetical protein
MARQHFGADLKTLGTIRSRPISLARADTGNRPPVEIWSDGLRGLGSLNPVRSASQSGFCASPNKAAQN